MSYTMTKRIVIELNADFDYFEEEFDCEADAEYFMQEQLEKQRDKIEELQSEIEEREDSLQSAADILYELRGY